MELIVISDAKLKVMLTAEDMKRYELDSDHIDYDNTETKRVLWEILDEVKHRTGFDAGGERVLVQLYPSRGGGCELFVTKLGRYTASRGADRGASISLGEMRSCLFSFETMGDLLRVCRQLGKSGYTLLSTAYVADDGRCYLVLQERPTKSGSPGALSFIEEFGRRRRGGAELAYIKEHSVCIADSDAVARLAPLAV